MATPIQNLMAQLFQLVQLKNQQRGLDIQESQVESTNQARQQQGLESAMTLLSNVPMESRAATIEVLAQAGLDPVVLSNLAQVVPESAAIRLDKLRAAGLDGVNAQAAASAFATGALPGQLAADQHTADTFNSEGRNLGLTPQAFQAYLQEGFARGQTGLTAGGRATDAALAGLPNEQLQAGAQIGLGLRMSAPQAANLAEGARQFNEGLDFNKLRFGAENANDIVRLQLSMMGLGEEGGMSPSDQVNALRSGLTAMEILQQGRLPTAGAHAVQNIGAQLMFRSGVMSADEAARLFRLGNPGDLAGHWSNRFFRRPAGPAPNTLQQQP